MDVDEEAEGVANGSSVLACIGRARAGPHAANGRRCSSDDVSEASDDYLEENQVNLWKRRQ